MAREDKSDFGFKDDKKVITITLDADWLRFDEIGGEKKRLLLDGEKSPNTDKSELELD